MQDVTFIRLFLIVAYSEKACKKVMVVAIKGKSIIHCRFGTVVEDIIKKEAAVQVFIVGLLIEGLSL